MFKKTINFSLLNNGGSSEVTELEGDDVIQILHRGHEVKVMMTQEHYFELMAKAKSFEKNGDRVSFDRDRLLRKIDSKKRAINDIMDREDQN